MGWTWRANADIMLARYPQLANIKELVARWPQLQTAIEQQNNGESNVMLSNNGKGLPLLNSFDGTASKETE